MARQTFSISGLRELDAALGQLPKATGKNVLRRVGRKALVQVVDAARPRAPVRFGNLAESLSVSTKLSKRQRSIHRKLVADGKASVEVYAGATALPHAHLQEFGTVHHGPQPFMRPAWGATQNNVLSDVSADLWTEVEKSARRLARKQVKQTRKRLGLE